VGETLQVLATDPSTERDIPKFCHFLGHELLQQDQFDGHYRYLLRKQASS
jgi:tRNA 2-thiouridine synthesizing protein A